MQQLDAEIGQQEPSVRQLFQKACRMALQRPVVARPAAKGAVPDSPHRSFDDGELHLRRSRSSSMLQERRSMQLPGRPSTPDVYTNEDLHVAERVSSMPPSTSNV